MASSLHNAKKAKNDEFYTRYKDISEEMGQYRDHFKGKIVYCNCDDPTQSNFWRYFHNNFASLGLKKLIATHFQEDSEPSYALVYEGGNDFDMDVGQIVTIYGDENYTAGDFRSQDSIKYLKEADIIITNPPFSLFREYIGQLIEFDKSFIVVGNHNAVTYKEIFPLIKNNQIWLGANYGDMAFKVPAHYEPRKTRFWIDETGQKWRSLGNICWFTNLDFKQRHDGLWHIRDKFDHTKAHKYYEGFEEKYPKYDNYNGINIDNVKDIPIDYEGMMGVPITYIDKFNPNEFEILGCSYSYGDPGEPYHVDGESFNVSVENKNVYKRIFIRNLNPIKRSEDKGY